MTALKKMTIKVIIIIFYFISVTFCSIIDSKLIKINENLERTKPDEAIIDIIPDILQTTHKIDIRAVTILMPTDSNMKVISTTKIPAKIESPTIGTYFLADPTKSDVHCIKATFGAQITITYTTTNNEELKAIINVPTSSKIRGECGKYLELAWASTPIARRRRDISSENTLRLDIEEDIHKNVYYVSSVSYSLLRDDVNFPGIVAGPPLTNIMSNLRAFETLYDTSYSCKRTTLIDSFEVKFWDMQFEAFNKDIKPNFKIAVDCRRTIEESATHVGIAAGVSLAALVIIGGAIALISHYRKRRKEAAAALVGNDTLSYAQFAE